MKDPYVVFRVMVVKNDSEYWECKPIEDKKGYRFKCGYCLRGNIASEFWVDLLHGCKVCGAKPTRVFYWYAGEPRNKMTLKVFTP